jgi:transcription initiation factor TFIIH subunit 1
MFHFDGKEKVDPFSIHGFPCIYKKRGGKMYITNIRVIWMLEGETEPSLTIPYEMIKVHSVSRGDPPMMKIVAMYSKGNDQTMDHIFTFSGPSKDRDTCRDQITNYLKLIRSGPNTPTASSMLNLTHEEIELRIRVLSKDKELAQLHTKLVGGGHLTDNEFWESRKVKNG